MSRYNTFLLVFILSILALIVFLYFYLSAIFSIVIQAQDHAEPDPFEIVATLFNPAVMISGLVLALSSILYRVLGIVHVARSKTVSDGEKAIWIIGFVLVGFITGIVFLVMAKGRKFVD
jgi:hypothetical protein